MTLGKGEVFGRLLGLQGGRGEQTSLDGPAGWSWDLLRGIIQLNLQEGLWKVGRAPL